MTKTFKFTRESLIYSIIFIAALFLRLLLLGNSSLVESEAAWAFQAWQIHLGEPIQVGSPVVYLSLTEALFTLIGGSDFLARLWPALLGSLIVWVPYLVRKDLGQTPALLLAVGLAFDPALVGISRIAGGPVPALVLLLLAVAAFHTGKLSWLVLFLGLGLFSGPAFWLGMFFMALAVGGGSLLGWIDLRQYIQMKLSIWQGDKDRLSGEAASLVVPALILLLVGSFFLRHFQGLSAWAGSLPEFIETLVRPGGVNPLRMLINLAVSNPFILVFGISGYIYSWRMGDRIGKLSSLWFGLSLLVLLIIPGRQAADLVWLVIPLWIPAAGQLFRIFQLAEDSWGVYALAGLVGVLVVLNWLTFTGMVFQIENSRAVLLQGGLLAASLALVVLSMTIAASEWGWPVSLKGLGLGAAAMLLIYMLSAMTQGAYLRQADPRSLWSDGLGAGQIGLLQDSIYDVSISFTGRGDAVQGVVIGSWDVLRWGLRDLSGIEFQESLDPESLPPLIITAGNQDFLVNQEFYRGQDFILTTRPGWQGMIPPDWISWIAFRSGPVEKEDIILWIRNDIFSGY